MIVVTWAWANKIDRSQSKLPWKSKYLFKSYGFFKKRWLKANNDALTGGTPELHSQVHPIDKKLKLKLLWGSYMVRKLPSKPPSHNKHDLPTMNHAYNAIWSRSLGSPEYFVGDRKMKKSVFPCPIPYTIRKCVFALEGRAFYYIKTKSLRCHL